MPISHVSLSIHFVDFLTMPIKVPNAIASTGRGRDAWGLADLHIEDRLRHYMSGGSEPTDVCVIS